jgi:hypothetical protein
LLSRKRAVLDTPDTLAVTL